MRILSKLNEFLNSASSQATLSDQDPLYRDIVSKLPEDYKSEYCCRLLNRARFDLQNSECENEKRALSHLIESAQQEISTLNSDRQ